MRVQRKRQAGRSWVDGGKGEGMYPTGYWVEDPWSSTTDNMGGSVEEVDNTVSAVELGESWTTVRATHRQRGEKARGTHSVDKITNELFGREIQNMR